MWVKEHPKKAGYYWVKGKNINNDQTIEIVFLYKTKKGYNVLFFGAVKGVKSNSDMFVEWWDKKLIEPPDKGYSQEFKTPEGVIEFLNKKGYKGRTFDGAVNFAISLGLDVAIRSNGYSIECQNSGE